MQYPVTLCHARAYFLCKVTHPSASDTLLYNELRRWAALLVTACPACPTNLNYLFQHLRVNLKCPQSPQYVIIMTPTPVPAGLPPLPPLLCTLPGACGWLWALYERCMQRVTRVYYGSAWRFGKAHVSSALRHGGLCGRKGRIWKCCRLPPHSALVSNPRYLLLVKGGPWASPSPHGLRSPLHCSLLPLVGGVAGTSTWYALVQGIKLCYPVLCCTELCRGAPAASDFFVIPLDSDPNAPIPERRTDAFSPAVVAALRRPARCFEVT